MKSVASSIVLAGLFSLAQGTPNPHNGDAHPSSSLALMTTFPPSAVFPSPTDAFNASTTYAYPSGYPSPCYIAPSAYPTSLNVTNGTITVTWATVPTASTITVNGTSSPHHENWGKGSATSSVLAYPTIAPGNGTYGTPFPVCPPGYFPPGNGTNGTFPTPTFSGNVTLPSPTSSVNNTGNNTNPQGLNDTTDPTKPGSAVANAKLTLSGAAVAALLAIASLA